jgi:hypothetical protein
MDCLLRKVLLVATIGSVVLFVGCSSNNSGGTGQLSLAVSDGPIHEAEKVCITFDEIEFKGDGEKAIVTLDPPITVNLLAFQGMDASPLLVDHQLPAGFYQWARLGVDAVRGGNGGLGDTGGPECNGPGSYIVLPTGTFNLYVPSSEQTGLKLVSGFTVPVNGSVDVTAEFDLMQSVTAPDGLSPDVILKPTIRLVDNIDAGTLTGMVTNDLATADNCEPSVYVFDQGVVPNPIDDDPDDPVATAMVNLGNQGYEYTVGYLLAGDYQAAFTCDGQNFEPVNGKFAPIFVNEIAKVDFP